MNFFTMDLVLFFFLWVYWALFVYQRRVRSGCGVRDRALFVTAPDNCYSRDGNPLTTISRKSHQCSQIRDSYPFILVDLKYCPHGCCN